MEEINSSIEVEQNTFTAEVDENRQDINVFVPEDADKMNEYVVLKDKDESDKIYDLPKEGGIITQKLADLLNVTEGDTIQINGEDQEVYEVEVKGIVEHYFQHYVYMSP